MLIWEYGKGLWQALIGGEQRKIPVSLLVDENGDPVDWATIGAGAAGTDREVVVIHYEAIANGTGYSDGDTITLTQVLNVSVAPPVTIASVWRNQTAGADLVTPPLAVDISQPVPKIPTPVEFTDANGDPVNPGNPQCLGHWQLAVDQTGADNTLASLFTAAGGNLATQITAGASSMLITVKDWPIRVRFDDGSPETTGHEYGKDNLFPLPIDTDDLTTIKIDGIGGTAAVHVSLWK